MWFLWVFGDNIEAHLGKIKYLLLFLASGVAGNIAQFAFISGSNIPMLGASGAVSGVLGAYAVLFPGSRIKSLVVLLFFISIAEIPAVIYIFYWFFLQFLSGVVSLPLASTTGGVAFWAHVGGFLTGLYLARRFKPVMRKPGVIEGELVD
jgi:membrane associated rhomboid family serine protease